MNDTIPRKKFSGFLLFDGYPVWGEFDPDASEPVQVRDEDGIWVFRRKCYRVEEVGFESPDEIALRIKHAAYKAEKALNKIQKEVAVSKDREVAGAGTDRSGDEWTVHQLFRRWGIPKSEKNSS